MVYLDNAATSWPKPERVYEVLGNVLQEAGGNPGRGGHTLADRAYRRVTACRNAIARLLGIEDPREVILTSGATEGLNLVLKGLLNAGDRVVTTSMEHNSVMRPLMSLREDRGIEPEIQAVKKFSKRISESMGRK